MKNYTFQKLILLTLTLGLLTVQSCSDDDTTAAPEAAFSTSVDGKTVAFTNTTVGEDVTYAWDFGDGETSTELSPTHTYAANNSYVVTLTATNDGGTDEAQAVLEIINITIDGDFSDWEDVDYAVQYSNEEGGTLTGLKIDNLSNDKLYVYIEGTSDLTALTQVFLNTDNDVTTGAGIAWRYYQAGEDYLIEGQFLADENSENIWYSLYQCDGCEPGIWDWTDLGLNSFITASTLQSISGGNAYEFSIDLTAFPTTISDEAIGIGVMDINPDNWAENGQIPRYYNENDCPECSIYLYELK